MKEPTQEEMLEISCAPAATDEPEESDFLVYNDSDEIDEETFVKNMIMKELN